MPKKKGGKKKKAKAERTETLHEVDKTFYELTITDLNRKLARLRAYSVDLEEKVLILETAQSKTEQDRGDVICYLKRSLQEKTSEAIELQDRVITLETAQESNEEAHQQEIADLKAEFESMREQLVSELKLITGKLNALEEFRMQRDELMSKFEVQENQIEEQEIRHKKNMYEVERKFILGKDAIKHEMEQQLFQLAKDFESANELRIAATTQRVIRENIVINNELNKLIFTSEDFQKENSALKAKIKELTSFSNILESERNKALKDYTIQKGVIHQMVHEIARQKELTAGMECDIERGKQAEKELKLLKLTKESLLDKIKTYEQQMHSIRCNEIIQKHSITSDKVYIKQLQGIIFETLYNIEALMELQDSEEDEKRAKLFGNIYSALRRITHEIPSIKSEDTLYSSSHLYRKGDLGIVPRISKYATAKRMHLHEETMMGASFHDFLLKQKEAPTEETQEVDNVPEILEFDYKEITDTSEETLGSILSEESLPSSKADLEKEPSAISHPQLRTDVDLVLEEEEIEEEEIEEEENLDALSITTYNV